jgi:hypothetical protein
MFNRFVSKTVLKTCMTSKYSASAVKLMMMSSNNQLIRQSKMNFFDYDNKDKNIFSSDEEDNTSNNRQRDNRGFDDGDDFFSQNSQQHDGKYTVEEIPLYITKMRREIGELRRKNGFERRNGKQLKDSYFQKINNLTSMFYQNKDQIAAEYPRFATVLYEFLAYNDVRKANQTYDSLEDIIVDSNIENMPIPGVKNFVQAMNISGRGRKEILDRVKAHLVERNAYNDVRANMNIVSAFTNLRALDAEYLHQSLIAIQDEMKRELDNSTADLDRGIIIYPGAARHQADAIIRHLAEFEVEITEEDVKSFLANHQAADFNGRQFVVANEHTKEFKDYVLLGIYQYVLLYNDKEARYNDLVNLMFFSGENSKYTSILENIPHLKEMRDNGIEEFKKGINDERKPRANINQTKIQNCLTELGVYFKQNERIIDIFKSDFYIPDTNTIFEYNQPSDYVKTADVKGDKLHMGRYNYRRALLNNNGFNVVTMDYFDMIEADGRHPALVKTIRERLGLTEAKKEEPVAETIE